MEEIKYNKPIQVNFGTYVFLRKQFAGMIASREVKDSEGYSEFYIKIWLMKYKDEILKYLKD